MKSIYLLPILLLAFSNYTKGQSEGFNLKHLTKEEYIKQIELCADSAYADAGMEGVQSTYDENTYKWTVEQIDNTIDKYFSSRITHDNMKNADIVYRLIWYRDKKYLSIGLSFFLKGKSIGSTYILYGVMGNDAVQGIIKTFSSKKEIRKIFDSGVK